MVVLGLVLGIIIVFVDCGGMGRTGIEQRGGEQRDLVPGGGAHRADQGGVGADVGRDAGEVEDVGALRREHSSPLISAARKATSTYATPTPREAEGGLEKGESRRRSGPGR